jgi:hypothetical protein
VDNDHVRFGWPRRAWTRARKIPLLGWYFIAGFLVLAALLINTALQGNREVDAAKPTTLHVTGCWTEHETHGFNRYCAIKWSLPDGTGGSGSIQEDDTSIDTGSTIHGWATTTKAWTSSPKRRSSPWDWVVAPAIVLGCVALGFFVWRGSRSTGRRGNEAREPQEHR